MFLQTCVSWVLGGAYSVPPEELRSLPFELEPGAGDSRKTEGMVGIWSWDFLDKCLSFPLTWPSVGRSNSGLFHGQLAPPKTQLSPCPELCGVVALGCALCWSLAWLRVPMLLLPPRLLGRSGLSECLVSPSSYPGPASIGATWGSGVVELEVT